MKDHNNLREYFEEHIEPAIPPLKQEYEIYFQSLRNLILRRMNWVLIGLLGIASGLRMFRPELLPSNMFGWTIFVLFIYFFVKHLFIDSFVKESKEAKAFSLKFKQKMILPILQVFDNSLQLYPESRINTNTLYKSGLFYPIYRMLVEGEDLVKGNYKGTELSFSEMKITIKKSGDKHDVQFFNGLFLEATLPKSLHGAVYLIPSSAFSGPMDLFKMKIFRGKEMSKEEKKAHNMNVALHASSNYRWKIREVEKEIGMKLEEMFIYDEATNQSDEMMDEHFKIYADKPTSIDALWNTTHLKNYIFTYKEDETAMEKVVKTPSLQIIDNNAIGRLMRRQFIIGVVNDKAYLAVPFAGKNLFDPDWSDNFLSFENVEEMYDELNSIFNFLDAMIPQK